MYKQFKNRVEQATAESRLKEVPMKKPFSPLLIAYGVVCLFFAAAFETTIEIAG